MFRSFLTGDKFLFFSPKWPAMRRQLEFDASDQNPPPLPNSFANEFFGGDHALSPISSGQNAKKPNMRPAAAIPPPPNRFPVIATESFANEFKSNFASLPTSPINFGQSVNAERPLSSTADSQIPTR